MNRSMLAGCATLFFTISVGLAQAQVAGSTTVGVEVSELQEVAIGWSAKKQIPSITRRASDSEESTTSSSRPIRPSLSQSSARSGLSVEGATTSPFQ
jgi:hypothetical protein